MMTEPDYYFELYQNRIKRLRRNIFVLFFVLGLVVVNGLSVIFKLNDYEQQLPGALYDFSVKYESVLIEWWADNRQNVERNTDSDSLENRITISFDNGYANRQLVTNWQTIPFLTGYLDAQLPEVRAGQAIFNYKLDYPLYLFVVPLLPVFFLFWIYMDARVIYKLRSKLAGEDISANVTRAMIESVIFLRIDARKNNRSWTHTILIFFLTLILSNFIALVSISTHDTTKLDIQGALVLNPPGIPVVKMRRLAEDEEFHEERKKDPDFYLYLILVVFFASLVLSILIAQKLFEPPVAESTGPGQDN